jgi:hypothetical protein
MATSELSDLVSQDQRDFHNNMALGCAGLVEGTNANTIKIANPVHYRIDGQVYYKAITDNIAMTACAAQANGTVCYYLVTINASGTVKLTKGADGSAILPAIPNAEALLGVMKVTASASFTSGTDDLGSQDAWANCNYLPLNGLATSLTFA